MRSLRARLLMLLAAVVLAGTALQLGSAFRAAMVEADDLFDYHMRQIALSVAEAGYGIVPLPDLADEPEEFDFVVQIWARDGVRVYQSHRHTRLPDQAVLGFSFARSPDGVWRVFAVQTSDRTIQVAQNVSVRRALAMRLAARAVWPIIPLAVLLLGGVWWIVTSSLSPIKRTAAELARQDPNALVPLSDTGLPEEVKPMVTGMNSLMHRVAEVLESQQRFVADAAHELRSPLTALKLQVQLLERAGDAAARETALARLRQGVQRAIHLVEQLLVLERQQAGVLAAGTGAAAEATQATTSLAAAARLVVDEAQALADARGHALELEVAGDPAVRAQGDSMVTLVRNLVDNAIRYTPDAGQVQVRVALERTAASTGDQALLVVDDSGPGIPPGERARVFDRFYRRSGEQATGSGLGLAIVAAIVERCRGRIELGDSPLGGLRVSVRLPAAPATASASSASSAPPAPAADARAADAPAADASSAAAAAAPASSGPAETPAARP